MTHLSKLPNVKTTIFTIMNRLAKEYNAINLSQGFPDFESDPKLIELVSKAMKNSYNQYAPMPGVLTLREQIAKKIHRLYNVNYHPETEITVTVGATQAIFTIISTFISKDDEVIVFKPAYDCYEPTIELHKGKPVFVQLKAPDYKVNWEEVRAKITTKTKMIIINTPQNPCGTIWSSEDILALENIVKGTNIIVLSDEVYEHIIFDSLKHQSVCQFPQLKERSFVVASFGKTFHNTGWKTGYCAAPCELMHEFRKVHQFNVFCVNHPMQMAFAEYLKDENHYLELSNFYQNKRDFFLNAIKDSRFNYLPSKGTYFQLLEYSAISNEYDVDFVKRLAKEHKIAAIPVSVFNTNNLDQKMIRLCFAKKEETLEKATHILTKI
ncbi:methionine aminotransferase [Aureibaculum sp. 2210JD6-5]|uniref:methionine aminotransferase n=1 Tax=Aureibaculum sp. 2210JD6-5 TaxID=3103957 RepID=UPI002AAEDB38|nr:methionine aminotransferase [Aureibaculum sp. 2210JD6-5]MDY7395682.1 methionine aminotransferase [Aureibaculum sp. 2210JD6-5]